MPVRLVHKKDPAAVALGRKGGRKGGLARAAKLSPKQRSESARTAVQARWAKAKAHMPDTSDRAVVALLKRLKAATDPSEIRHLTDQLERAIFHKQYENA